LDPSVFQEFVLESSHSLQSIEQDLVSLERTADPATLGKIFRGLHSIKGSAAFLELTAIEKLSHQAETLLDLLRQKKRELTPATTDALLRCVDVLSGMVTAPDFGLSVDLKPTIALLQPFIQGKPSEPTHDNALTTDVAQIVAAKINANVQILDSDTINSDSANSNAAPAKPPLDQTWNRPSSQPPMVTQPVQPVVPASNVIVQPPVPQPATPRIEVKFDEIQKAGLSNSSISTRSRSGQGQRDSDANSEEKQMRVRVKFLDDLLQLTGNMVMARNQLLSKYSFTDDPAFVTLSQCVTEVHKTIVQTRMNPIGTLFDRCERLVRDVARQVGKEVDLEVTGRDLELDRSVLETFADPLMHLIRNAIDHGLETPGERQSVGKPRNGQIRLGAREQAGEVILSVEDDGRGIDLDRVKERALSNGLITAQQAANLSSREIMHLLFKPGFSTRDEVTNLSGRGVGLDVVRTNIEGLGGIVEVQSTLGKGTSFFARMPLTQALVSSTLISALIVQAKDERYAIPQTAVDEIIKVDTRTLRDSIHIFNGQKVYQLRDLVLPVVSLAEVLGRTESDPLTGDGRILIVMQFREKLFGLLVEAILAVEEIVVRPLPDLVKNCKIFKGHTVLGDGQVALILNRVGIIQQQKLIFSDDVTAGHLEVNPSEQVDGPQRIVVFSFAEGEYFAIPLELVSIIEKIPIDSIKKVGAKEYIQVNKRTMPVMRLDKVMSVGALEKHKEAYLMIPARVSFPIAILAGRSLEVVEIAEHYEARLSDGQGMLGTFMHRGNLVMLLDLYRLFERHSPDQFRMVPVEQRPAHLLLAEDSPFFQNLIRSYLENPPRKLTVVADGMAALELLQMHPDEYDLLVTDIEMPRMDGFELVSKLRSDPILRTLPVIAVTSLATPEHIERGLREGFDSYLIKIDKEQLLRTIDRFLDRGMKHRAAISARKGG
jgi:two-component system, chemotaxis family, sensor kinase CheA